MSRSVADIRFPIFMERFNILMGNMTQVEFAKKLGMSRATVGFYCAGIRIPDALGVAKIAKICGVTSDWILGLTDVRTSDIETQAVQNYTGLSEGAVKSLQKYRSFLTFTEPLNYLLTDLHFWKILCRIMTAFIQDEIAESDLKLIPLKTKFYPYIDDVLFARLIKEVPNFINSFKSYIKSQPQTLELIMYEKLYAIADIQECRQIAHYDPPIGAWDYYNDEDEEIYYDDTENYEDVIRREQETLEAIREEEELLMKRECIVEDFLYSYYRYKEGENNGQHHEKDD